VERTAESLELAGVDPARREAEWIVEAVTGFDRAAVALHEGVVPVSWLQQVEELAARRAAGEPLQYVTGVAGFRYLELEVGPGVFIPRPETEALVELALARLPEDGVLVDLCTGSGAIALAAASERPDARVLGTELYPDALEWARRNHDRLGSRAEFLEGDLFAPLPLDLRGAIDVITANPPYIAVEEQGALPSDVIDHEPHDALFSGSDGMKIVERIVAAAPEWVRSGGRLLLEIGEHQRTLAGDLLERSGWSEVTIHLDLADRPRIAEARWLPS
jgi:release factor glutamine methyltransferase